MDDLLSNKGVGNELQAVAQAKPENNTTKGVLTIGINLHSQRRWNTGRTKSCGG
jgi:hypothetical protein